MQILFPAVMDDAAMLDAAVHLLGRPYGTPFEGLALNCAVATARILEAGGAKVVRMASIASSNPMFEEPFKLGPRATQWGPYAAGHGVLLQGLTFQPLEAPELHPKPNEDRVLHHHMTERVPVSASEHVLPIIWVRGEPYVFDARPSGSSLLPFTSYVSRYFNDVMHGPTRFHIGCQVVS